MREWEGGLIECQAIGIIGQTLATYASLESDFTGMLRRDLRNPPTTLSTQPVVMFSRRQISMISLYRSASCESCA